jgi:hypothetical protein
MNDEPTNINLIKNAEKIKADFYENNKKKSFFKSAQKIECAKQVFQNMDIRQLIVHSFYLIPNTNCIYFDYPLFKTYACAEVYEDFTTHAYTIINTCLSQYPSFDIHVNMQSFTISAFERLRKLIERFFVESPLFSDKLTFVYIYYTPSIIEQINKMIKMFIAHISYKIVYFSKTESHDKMKMLFSGHFVGHQN